jgi:hypothetical protein
MYNIIVIRKEVKSGGRKNKKSNPSSGST